MQMSGLSSDILNFGSPDICIFNHTLIRCFLVYIYIWEPLVWRVVGNKAGKWPFKLWRVLNVIILFFRQWIIVFEPLSEMMEVVLVLILKINYILPFTWVSILCAKSFTQCFEWTILLYWTSENLELLVLFSPLYSRGF